MESAVAIDLFQILFCGRNRERWRPSQLSYAPPAVSALPPRHQFEDFVDGVMLLLRAEFDASHEELVNGWQQARVDYGLASNVLDNARHIQNRAASQRSVIGLQPTRQKRGLRSRLQDQHAAQAGAGSPHNIPQGMQR